MHMFSNLTTSVIIVIAFIAISCFIIFIDKIKKAVRSALGLDDIYVNKENCTACKNELYHYVNDGQKQILDKLDENTKMISEMSTTHKIFLKFIERRLED